MSHFSKWKKYSTAQNWGRWPSLRGSLFTPQVREKDRQGFITNCPADTLKNTLHEYELAAKQAGVTLSVQDNASDINGRLIKNYRALYISDPSKRAAFWAALRNLDTTKNKLCSCEIAELMRSGCQCSGT